jgi:glycosyltransferase involved in cell wall biosynthesis
MYNTTMRKNDVTISACIVVYEEEGNIKELLQNIELFINEIVLVYDGEDVRDKTLEIATKFCDEKKIPLKIFKRPHTGNAEILRPFSFKQATGNWIFWIDGDERIVGDYQEVRQFIKNHPKVSRIRFLLGTSKELGFRHAKRRASLFKKDAIFFFGVPHQKVELLNGKSYDYPECVQILHLETRRSFRQLILKSLGWSKIYAASFFMPIQEIEKFNTNKEIENNFDNVRKKKIDYAFFLMFFSSIKNFLTTLIKRKDIKISLTTSFFVFMSYFYIVMGRFKKHSINNYFKDK